ncbi:hypothetical protein GCM10009751_18130 [Myceligenerans crystallogenes]|uniref:CorA-like Mg2+ transporter protein n=1 Tax=Myceligenerans crystallogenes TaxID=316335 RepID=A0ABN2NAT6_9MICO
MAAASNHPYFDPPTARSTIRVTNVYGTEWLPVEDLDGIVPVTGRLRFGRLADAYTRGADQLPAVVATRELDAAELGFRRWAGTAERAGVWLFVLPSGRAVVGLTIDFSGAPLDAIDLLEDCYYGDVTAAGTDVADLAARLARESGIPAAEGLAPERHQLVFLPVLEERYRQGPERFDLMQRLVYRADLPSSEESSSIEFPGELNRHSYAPAAVGPYVSVLAGQQDYVENAALVSAVQCVGAEVMSRKIWEDANEDFRRFHDDVATAGSRQQRLALEPIARKIARRKTQLSHDVESVRELDLVVRSLRVLSFHKSLFDAMGLRERCEVVDRLLARNEQAMSAEATAIASAERRADDVRRFGWSLAVVSTSTFAIPVTVLLAFFGVNAAEVDGSASMFSAAYLPVYLATVAVCLIVGAGPAVAWTLVQRSRLRQESERSQEAVNLAGSQDLIRRRRIPIRR